MPIWKQIILGLYYTATLPVRAIRTRLAALAGRAPIMIFTWHRIADDAANGWTTNSEVFAREIAWLKRHFDMISLEEAQRRIASGRNHRPAACVTFDDGYAVNCQKALPMLIREQVPVTYFVTTEMALTGKPFPHDAEMGCHWKPNTIEQLKAMAAAGIEIGAHTRTHPDIGKIENEAELYDEIVKARDDLSEALDLPIRYFAFPFGQHANLGARAFEIAKDGGFEAVMSAYGGYHFPGDDPFHLQRMCVDGPLIRLKNWAGFDPWKQIKIKRYEPESKSTRQLSSGVATV